MEEIIYLDEGKERLENCPNCNRSICFLPDMSSIPKIWGRLTIYKWYCHNCKIEFFQTKRDFNLNTVEGSEEYLKSEGIDIEQCVKDGRTVITILNDRL